MDKGFGCALTGIILANLVGMALLAGLIIAGIHFLMTH